MSNEIKPIVAPARYTIWAPTLVRDEKRPVFRSAFGNYASFIDFDCAEKEGEEEVFKVQTLS